MPSDILVLYAHPFPYRSVVNRLMADAARALPRVELLDLYESAPDFHFDFRREQERVNGARLLVFQHPLHWYGMPALLKQWVDVVLRSGWAHGREGHALRGKDFLLAVSTGGDELDYQRGGKHGHAFDVFLPPFQQMAVYCGMRWQTPLVFHAAHRAGEPAVHAHVDRYQRLLQTYPDWAAAADSAAT